MARPAIHPDSMVTSLTSTQFDIVTEQPSPVRAPSPRHRWWAVPTAVVGCLAIVAPVAASFLPAKWLIDKDRCTTVDAAGECTIEVVEAAEFAIVPADAEPVRPRLEVSGVETYPSEGRIYFVTVREPAITILDWFATHDEPSVRLLSHYEKFGDQTAEERIEQGQLQMSGAKEWAIYNALTLAGLEPEFVLGEAMVQYVLCLQPSEDDTECLEYAPANDFLQPFDVITDVDGTEVVTLDDLRPITEAHEPGDTVTITVLRGDEVVTGEVELIQAPEGDEVRAIIGFMPVDTTRLQLPEGLSVSFSTENIGGPSAGLAFTLTLIDALTEGDLTGGIDVAVTGAIDVEGNVRAIGGLSSKASAVDQVGVKYFLVPASQPETGADSLASARAVVGDDVEIIPVATLAEALEVLASLGGDPLPSSEAPTDTTA